MNILAGFFAYLVNKGKEFVEATFSTMLFSIFRGFYIHPTHPRKYDSGNKCKSLRIVAAYVLICLRIMPQGKCKL